MPHMDRHGPGGGNLIQKTPTPSASKRPSRWGKTPSVTTPGTATPSAVAAGCAATPGTPGTPMTSSTPATSMAMGMATPGRSQLMAMTPEQQQAWRWEKEVDERNRPMTDDDLDAMFPPSYKVLPPVRLTIQFLSDWMFVIAV